MTAFRDALQPVLPDDSAQAALAGRVWRPDAAGPSVVAVRDGDLLDISASFPTMRDLCEADAPADRLRAATGERIGRLDDVLANTPPDGRDHGKPWLLAPIDLQAIKAAGVTFVVSMIERVIEERARGDLNAAAAIRAEVNRLVGDDLARLKPGSAEAAHLKQVLIEQNAWSQYLEVGIGPDAEIFTKAQPMAAVGTGMDAGIHPNSSWNNPEPEVVLAASSTGRIVAATLGQRREPARRGGTFRTAARQGEGQQRVLRDRSVPALLRCALHAGRHTADDGFVERRRDRSLPDGRRVIDREDQP